MKKPPNYDDLKSSIHAVGSRPFNVTSLIYGKSGSGKTHFASTFPRPALLIDVMEGGTDTIQDEEDIDVLEVKDWSGIVGAYWMLQNGDAPREYKTIIVDQISKLQDLAMSQAMSEAGKAEGATLTMRDWGNVSGMMKSQLFSLIDWCKSNHVHLVLIAHDRVTNREEGDDDAIDPSVGARLMPSVATAINGAVDLIGCTYIREEFVGPKKEREVAYCLRIGPNGVYTTKLRRPPARGEVPEYLEDPHFNQVVDMVRPNSKPKRAKKRKTRKKTS